MRVRTNPGRTVLFSRIPLELDVRIRAYADANRACINTAVIRLLEIGLKAEEANGEGRR